MACSKSSSALSKSALAARDFLLSRDSSNTKSQLRQDFVQPADTQVPQAFSGLSLEA